MEGSHMADDKQPHGGDRGFTDEVRNPRGRRKKSKALR